MAHFDDDDGGPPEASLSAAVLAKAAASSRKKNEKTEDFLARVTHLQLENRQLPDLSGLERCRNLRVLYAYDNYLEEIPPQLRYLPRLKQLHLRGNQIRDICHLGSTSHLEKLDLDDNRIAEVSGLEACSRLKELRLARQRPGGKPAPLRWDPSSVRTLSASLEILDVTGNCLETLEPLRQCASLRILYAANNRLDSIDDIAGAIQEWRRIEVLDFRGNPVTGDRQYQKYVIGFAASGLCELDGADVPSQQREFLTRLVMKSHGMRPPTPMGPLERIAAREESAKRGGGRGGLGRAAAPSSVGLRAVGGGGRAARGGRSGRARAPGSGPSIPSGSQSRREEGGRPMPQEGMERAGPQGIGMSSTQCRGDDVAFDREEV